MRVQSEYLLQELAARANCAFSGDGSAIIRRASTIEDADEGAIVLAENDRFLAMAEASCAAAILVNQSATEPAKPALRGANVRLAWARVLEILYPPTGLFSGIHPSSVVDATADIAASAAVGPHCCIGPGSRVGERCVLRPGVIIGASVSIGPDTQLDEHVFVGDRCIIGARNHFYPGAVVGADGFGFARDGKKYHRIPQIGLVRTGDDVEIGVVKITVARFQHKFIKYPRTRIQWEITGIQAGS